ncbi:hypothetical protein QAD02_003856 [Eretmocerus hayati]|uniref:Uncharacterized protein n=1 Tax=Eretmocerus hayati TaxID=131215 RepID=A0ACC2NQR0_9HYME|nr:hypothetical protein QAD02_003856 [Eretmocerus hayati]
MLWDVSVFKGEVRESSSVTEDHFKRYEHMKLSSKRPREEITVFDDQLTLQIAASQARFTALDLMISFTMASLSLVVCVMVLLYNAHPTNVVFAQLTGDSVSCNSEGQPVSVLDVAGAECYACNCQKGLVVCSNETCPSLEGCYMVIDLKKEKCCPKCKGCLWNGEHHESGRSWTSPENPCRMFECIAGVITESTVECHVPCQNPMPAEKEQCCPTCRGCRLESGIKVPEKTTERTEVMPTKDPCVTCSCSSSTLSCSKTACPVLNCPISKVTHDPKSCCPRCTGSETRSDPTEVGACLIGSEIHGSGTSFQLDQCTRCSCQNSTIHCERQSCPVLNCERDQQEAPTAFSDSGCCSRCRSVTKTDSKDINLIPKPTVHINTLEDVDHGWTTEGEDDDLDFDGDDQDSEDYDQLSGEDQDENDQHKVHYDGHKDIPLIFHNDSLAHGMGKSCTYFSKTYKSGDTWKTDACENCTCFNGIATCKPIMCPAVTCASSSQLKILPGQCCPTCVNGEATCSVTAGTHFRTFDGEQYAFVGSCKYLLSSDCDLGSFSIRIRNSIPNNSSNRGNEVTLRRVALKLHKFRVDLQQQSRKTRVNDSLVDLPFRMAGLLIEELSGRSSAEQVISLTYEPMGLRLIFDREYGFLELGLAATDGNSMKFRGQLCGLCGNLNGRRQDDLTTREGIITNDPALFAQSWSLNDEPCFDNRNYGVRGCNPHRDKRLCNYIRGSIFEKCHRKLDVTTYFNACLQDQCMCPPKNLQCHCESFAHYVRDCRRLGIWQPTWRKSVGC